MLYSEKSQEALLIYVLLIGVPRVSSLFVGRKWDSVQRCRREGPRGIAPLCIALLGVSLDSADYTLGVPRVSSGVFVVSGSEVGHLSGLKN